MGCNYWVIEVLVDVIGVSVPSTGRSGLQLRWHGIGRRVPTGFSTLYGSKWVATGAWLGSIGVVMKFQYPLRVEVGCNMRRVAMYAKGSTFQYPLRVEVGCNRLRGGLWAGRSRVSVPSTGRSGLQRLVGRYMHVRLLRFSTLYGSKWVATLPL